MTRDKLASGLAGAVFAVSPGYVEAVAWVSAITELLSTFWLLVTALLVLSAKSASSARGVFAASITALLALFSHEAAAALFLLIPLLLWISGRRGWLRVRVLWPFAVVACVFVAAVVVANHRNAIFIDGHYTIGSHMISNGLNYVVSMYVGPHRWTGRLFVAAGVCALMLFGPRLARHGLLWMVIALLPFLGFTWETSGRYLYLPTMGFGWVLAGLIVACHKRLGEYVSPRTASAAMALVSLAIIVRFALFTSRSIADHVIVQGVYREYAESIVSGEWGNRVALQSLTVPEPGDRRIDRACIPALTRWVLKLPDLTVTVARRLP